VSNGGKRCRNGCGVSAGFPPGATLEWRARAPHGRLEMDRDRDPIEKWLNDAGNKAMGLGCFVVLLVVLFAWAGGCSILVF